ncbi:HepT-like ribonuclease domain-containing protein [Methylobacterium sp. JK268]
MPWREIAAIGNKLRHEYNRVDDLIIWQVATKALPSLRVVVGGLLKIARET